MPTVIPVKFKYAARDLWFDPGDTGAAEADHVICSTERGTEIGLATSDPFEVTSERLGQACDGAQLRSVLRVATEEDLDKASELADRGDDALPAFRRLVERSGLDMKPVGVEYVFGGERVVCYFAAEERIDFRQLVRDLSRELRGRVDMRQIGVREEAAIVGGYAHCGQELCCARFGRQFEPVSIRMAKEQDLPLNSSKISGACGRLMCCLRYEFEAYRDFKGRAPKKNAVIVTPLGKAKIMEYDTPKEQICLRLENGKQIRVPLARMECSPAACKKSEELGCPCRPDTVTRDALEALNSPDIQMALADLDRENGVLPTETFDAADLFVEPKRKRRAHKGGDGSHAGDGHDSSGQPGDASRSRRRRRGQGGGSPAPDEREGQRDDQGQEGASGQAGTRRRHHRSADAQRDSGGGEGQAKARRRRHPGDQGGQGGDAGPGPAHEGQTPGTEVPGRPRRRRHRGGRGHGGNGGGEATEASE